MNIKIHSAELNRMMKTVGKCIDDKQQKFSNIEISHDNNILSIRGTDGQFSAWVSTPLIGGDGEKFCIDGTMFAKVCAMNNGEVNISTDEKLCTIKGNGRTRIPVVDAEIPEYRSISENEPSVFIKSEEFGIAYKNIEHAISNDQARIQLTGVLTEVDETGFHMTSLDGFRMSTETIKCDGNMMKIIVPGSFMKLIQTGASAEDIIQISTDGKRIEVSTVGMRICSGLIAGDFPDISRIVPVDFKTECLVNVEQIQNALKSSSALNAKNNLVKLIIDAKTITVMSNSETADYDAVMDCNTRGDGLTIAFNQRFLIDTINSIDSDNVILKLNTPLSPCVVCGKDSHGLRLVLPVRVM